MKRGAGSVSRKECKRAHETHQTHEIAEAEFGRREGPGSTSIKGH
jgi:hypothetical protein